MNVDQLKAEINSLSAMVAEGVKPPEEQLQTVKSAFLEALEAGELRAAQLAPGGVWTVEPAVQKGILLIFKTDPVVQFYQGFSDKQSFTPRDFPGLEQAVRCVSGGTSIRRGAHISRGVVIMPPSFINIGASIGSDTMVDSHVLVGSCAQICRGVHLSAGVMIGGVLEPVGAAPVIIEDGAMIGGQCGIYEGVRIGRSAVIGTGTFLNASTAVYDVVQGRILKADTACPLTIPEGAVVVPGSRPLGAEFGKKHGLSIATPLIIKYRDAKTDAKTLLNEALREGLA